jgi:hypothetical protein
MNAQTLKITKFTELGSCQCRTCLRNTYSMHGQVTRTTWIVEIPGSRYDRDFPTKKAAMAFVAEQSAK